MSVTSAAPSPLSTLPQSPAAADPSPAGRAARETGAGLGRVDAPGPSAPGPARARRGAALRIAPSVLRMSLAGRLILAGSVLALLWSVVLLVVGSGA